MSNTDDVILPATMVENILQVNITDEFVLVASLYAWLHVKTSKLLKIGKQVVTRLLSSRYQDVFALLVPSCCDKYDTSYYHLVTRSMKQN